MLVARPLQCWRLSSIIGANCSAKSPKPSVDCARNRSNSNDLSPGAMKHHNRHVNVLRRNTESLDLTQPSNQSVNWPPRPGLASEHERRKRSLGATADGQSYNATFLFFASGDGWDGSVLIGRSDRPPRARIRPISELCPSVPEQSGVIGNRPGHHRRPRPNRYRLAANVLALAGEEPRTSIAAASFRFPGRSLLRSAHAFHEDQGGR